MRVLILNSKNGGGHTSVANSVKKFFVSQGHYVKIQDAVGFSSKFISDLVVFGYKVSYRYFPKIFSSTYKNINDKSGLSKHFTYFILKLGTKKLFNNLITGKYDCVICTHIFAGLLVKFTKEKFGINIPYAMIETDYSLSLFSDNFESDIHFVPTEKCKEELVSKGINKNKIVVSGIPVREEFYKKNKTINCRKKYLHDINCIHILLFGGLEAIGPLYKIVKSFTDKNFKNVELSIICGNNKLLFIKCNKLINNNLHVYKKVDNVAEIFDSVDIFISKPGGISITEASIKKLLTGYFLVIKAYEKDNIDYFVSNNAGVKIENVNNAICDMLDLYKDKNKKDKLINNAYKLVNKDSLAIIYNEIQKIIN